MHIISRGQKGDNTFVLTPLNQQFPTEPSSRAKFSRSTIGIHGVPSVHLRHCTHLDRFKHPILALFLHWVPFFWLLNVCTECWKPRCSAVSALLIQLPAGCRVAFISGSELTNADTDYLSCEEQFNQINLWEVPSASSPQSPTAKDWHHPWLA